MQEYSAEGGEALPEIPAAASPASATVLPAATAAGADGVMYNDENEAFTRLRTDVLVASKTNRTGFAQAELVAMSETIRARGVRHPLIVRRLPASRVEETSLHTPKGKPLPTHEIVCGERRWLSSIMAGVLTVPVIIRELTDAEALEEQVVENVVRESYTAIEEGEAYKRLLDNNALTAVELAKKVARSPRHIFNRIKLLDLKPETKQALLQGSIDATRALLLSRVPGHTQQLEALAVVSKKDWQGEFELSTREAEALIQREYTLSLGGAKFRSTDAELLPEAGSCRECPKRTGYNPDLHAEGVNHDVCTDPPCFRLKEEAHVANLMAEASARGQTVITGREAKALMPNSFGGIEGYLRLDDAKDSPTGKPLRKLLGSLIDGDEVKPTLLDNPHKPGDMIAVLPATKVSELLRARGHKEAAATVASKSKDAQRAEAEKEQRELAVKYEQAWRDQLLHQTWAEISEGDHSARAAISTAVARYLCNHLIDETSAAKAGQLCKVLDLGKVAPKTALLEHADDVESPEQLLLLLVMHKDLEFRSWVEDPLPANAGLLLVAKEYGVDVEMIKRNAKSAVRTAMSTKAVQKTDPSAPDMHSQGGKGGSGKSSSTAAKPRKKKLSADEAQLGIADAMQSLQNEQSDASGGVLQDDRAKPTLKPQPTEAAGAAFVAGDRIVVREAAHVDESHREFCGYVGTVKEMVAGEGSSVFQYMVALDMEWHIDGVRGFDPQEIEAN